MAWCMGPRLSPSSFLPPLSSRSPAAASSWRLMSSLLSFLPPRTRPSLPLPLPLPSSVVVRHFCSLLSKSISTATSPPLCSSLRTPDTEEGEPLEYVDADDDSDDNDEEEEEEDEEKDGDEAEE